MDSLSIDILKKVTDKQDLFFLTFWMLSVQLAEKSEPVFSFVSVFMVLHNSKVWGAS